MPLGIWARRLALVFLLTFAVVVLPVPVTSGAARVPVSSSFIAAIGWASGTLQVELLNGRIYEYYGVPRSVYSAFLSAPSKGKYFNAHVRGHYRYRRIR